MPSIGESDMNIDRQREQVDLNYDVLMRKLSELLPDHQDEYALMRDGEIVGLFGTPTQALLAATAQFPDGLFSIQQVTAEMDYCPPVWELDGPGIAV
jgi:hypothetical protein